MKKYLKYLIIGIFLVIGKVGQVSAQGDKELKWFLNEEKTRYIKGTGLGQIWVRYTDFNPGSTVFGTAKDQAFDVGLRRVRYQVMGQVTDHVFIYNQFGINSFG